MRFRTTEAHWGHGVFYFSSHFQNSPGQDTNLPGQDTNSPGQDTNSPGHDTNSPGWHNYTFLNDTSRIIALHEN